ncbi:cell division protein FtsI (penicillin-binding protein 3) [Parelusimicrobium proximum]|uniref:peptidoglycan D,D-transpeptidase FtsI family protein n=1 Tax=Parelusimicrobium proximum TaxID=3228953 RepID=UPI003D166901
MKNFSYNLKTRIKICAALCMVPVIAIIARLFYLQTFKYDEFSAKTDRTIYAELAEDRIRGSIYDVNGSVLAESLRTYSCAVLKKYTKDKDKSVAVLSEVLEIPKAEINKKWNSSGNFFYVAKKIKADKYIELTEAIRKNALSGLELTAEYERIHPYGDMLLDILGASNSKNLGLSGLEQLYNKTLSQDIKSRRAMRARKGQIIYERQLKEEAQVSDIYLTIDALSQYHVESVLEKYVKSNGAKRGMAIVMNPSTGFVIAMASYPIQDGQAMPFQFTYEPGSTFKSVTSSAAIDSGVWTADRVMDFGSKDKYEIIPGRYVRDTHHKREKMSLKEMMEISSNRGAARLSVALGPKDFFYYIKAFGFGTKTDIGFQGEARGVVRPFNKWTVIDTGAAGYGYGVSLTGVQLINAYSAIANGGELMQMHLIDKIVNAKGKAEFIAKPNKIRRVIKKETADEMTKVLRSVVENGARRARVKGYTVAGKTGTAEKLGSGGYEKTSHIVSFAGFVPATRPAFTILFVLDEPEKPVFGGESSAPAFAEIAERLLAIHGIPPDAE